MRHGSDRRWTRRSQACAVVLLGALGSVNCGPKLDADSANTQHATADDRIRIVAKSWIETSKTEAFLADPEVAWMHSDDQFLVHLGARGRTGIIDVERNEVIRLRSGSEYHCKVSGAVQASFHFAWRTEEATVTVRAPATVLERRCKERGFARLSKQVPEVNATYALRGDRLVAIDPPTLRSALIPAD